MTPEDGQIMERYLELRHTMASINAAEALYMEGVEAGVKQVSLAFEQLRELHQDRKEKCTCKN